MPETNITDEMKFKFKALISGKHSNFALFSCFADGKPTAAICAVNQEDGEYAIVPIVIFPPEGMELTDHEGNPA